MDFVALVKALLEQYEMGFISEEDLARQLALEAAKLLYPSSG